MLDCTVTQMHLVAGGLTVYPVCSPDSALQIIGSDGLNVPGEFCQDVAATYCTPYANRLHCSTA